MFEGLLDHWSFEGGLTTLGALLAAIALFFVTSDLLLLVAAVALMLGLSAMFLR
jgi:hypothetical protein